jgi:hypothetical protein
LLLIGAQLGVLACAQAACIDRATLLKTAVSVYRNFNAQERKLRPGILGIAGTGWFLSPRLLVTAAHVAEAMPLASTEWKDIEICNGKAKTVVPSRIHSLAGHLSERMTLLDVLVPVAGADALAVRREPLLRARADGRTRLPNASPSGAPVLDCQGRVVALVSAILTQTLKFGFRSVKVSTAWQTPNVISMPADALTTVSLAE